MVVFVKTMTTEGGDTMKIKQVFITVSIALSMLAVPFTVSAQSNLTPGLLKGARKSANLNLLNTLCTNAVNARVNSLNAVQARITALVKLSAAQKQQFSAEVSSDISGLQALQTQCANDFNAGNVEALRTDYHNLFLEFRVYAEFMPQLHLLIAADTMDVTADKLSDLAQKLLSRVAAIGNPANLTSLLADMQAKIADAHTQYANVQAQVTGLTPTSYDNDPSGTKSTFQNARSEIKTGASDLHTAWSDAKQVVAALKAMRTTPSPTQ